MLKGKKIILGITGSIAAYKACYIIRGLIKQGAEVQVVITPAGKEFITPITLSAIPLAILPIVEAVAGAINTASAHNPRSTWLFHVPSPRKIWIYCVPTVITLSSREQEN